MKKCKYYSGSFVQPKANNKGYDPYKLILAEMVISAVADLEAANKKDIPEHLVSRINDNKKTALAWLNGITDTPLKFDRCLIELNCYDLKKKIMELT